MEIPPRFPIAKGGTGVSASGLPLWAGAHRSKGGTGVSASGLPLCKRGIEGDFSGRPTGHLGLLATLIGLLLLLTASVATAQTGLVPLVDLGAGTYQGFEGGLYPGGANVPPTAHAIGARTAAGRVLPRNASGAPDPLGQIVVLSIGMSNTNQEFKAFERNADAEPTRSGSVLLVNGAVAGEAAEEITDPQAPYWSVVDQRLAALGVTAEQVQVVWLKQANGQLPTTDFPAHAEALRDDLADIVRNLRGRFPNLELCYLSSRIFGGYNTNPFRSEPVSYEGGFAVRWLIADQIAGDPDLNSDPAEGSVVAPWLLWGPYLWADGTTPRSDGLRWSREDLENDGVHPSETGEAKVAALLADFFDHEPTVGSWFRGAMGGASIRVVETEADATLSAAEPDTAFGLDSKLRPIGGLLPSHAIVRFRVPRLAGELIHAKLSLRNNSPFAGALESVADEPWDEASVTFSNGPAFVGTLGPIPNWSRDSALAHDVTAQVQDLVATGGSITLALRTTSGQGRVLQSRQDDEPPRLVLSLLEDLLLADGFESGDTSAWSSTTP